jgi:hypothetical protein
MPKLLLKNLNYRYAYNYLSFGLKRIALANFKRNSHRTEKVGGIIGAA